MTLADPVADALASYLQRVGDGAAETKEEFLAAHPEHATVLGRQLKHLELVQALDAMRPTAVEEPPGLPDQFDDFQLVGFLGGGGMGAVYEAIQMSLGREVAIKVIHEHAVTALRQHRFQREADVLAKSAHPNIVAVHALGVVRGRPYIVMDRVRGSSLSEWLPKGEELPTGERIREIVQLTAKIARALGHVHRLGVLHRDVKPDNVIINEDGEPVLLDFGLARDDTAPALTHPGDVLGTCGYLAPEQALGKDVDARADVYGVCATLYHLLTGVTPIVVSRPEDYLRLAEHGFARSPRTLNRCVPRDLASVVLKGVAPNHLDRYASARDLAADLEAWLAGKPVSARPEALVTAVVRWAARNPSRAALALVSLGLVVLLVGFIKDSIADRRARFAVYVEESLEEVEALSLRQDPAGAEQVLKELCDDDRHNADVWVMRLIAALSEPGRGVLSDHQRKPDRLAHARQLLLEMPSDVAVEPAIQMLGRWIHGKNVDGNSSIDGSNRSTLDQAVRMARVRHFLGQNGQVTVLRQIVSQAPDHYRAHRLLSRMAITQLIQSRRHPNTWAAESARAWRALRPKSTTAEYQMSLLEFLIQRTRRSNARTRRDNAQIDEEEVVAIHGMADARAQMQDLATAHPKNAVIAVALGFMFAEEKPKDLPGNQHWAEKAKESYERALRIAPNLSSAQLNLANLLWDLREGNVGNRTADRKLLGGRVMRLLDAIEKPYGNAASIWTRRATLLEESGQQDAAIALLRRARKHVKDDPQLIRVRLIEGYQNSPKARRDPGEILALAEECIPMLKAPVSSTDWLRFSRVGWAHCDAGLKDLTRFLKKCDELLPAFDEVWPDFPEAQSLKRFLPALRKRLRKLSGR